MLYIIRSKSERRNNIVAHQQHPDTKHDKRNQSDKLDKTDDSYQKKDDEVEQKPTKVDPNKKQEKVQDK